MLDMKTRHRAKASAGRRQARPQNEGQMRRRRLAKEAQGQRAAPGNQGTHAIAGTEKETLRDEVIDWLRDAYAMEAGLEASLQKLSANHQLDESLRNKAGAHLEETRHHGEQVKALLQTLNADTSMLKTGLGILAQSTKGIATAFAADERIKDLLDAYSMEHFEIACYAALVASAQQAGL